MDFPNNTSLTQQSPPNNAANNTSLTQQSPPNNAANNTSLTQQSPPNNNAANNTPLTQQNNGHLVYVRRKSEGEMPKNTPFENTATVDASSTQLYCQEEIAQPKPYLTPFPMPSGNPPSHSSANPKLFQNVQWEERYQHLHLFLRKLDQSDQADYIQMLQSLSSVELSRHAVELEKRSIQLSLEEAKELQRVAALNVLGKSVKNFKAPVDHGECSDKLKTFT